MQIELYVELAPGNNGVPKVDALVRPTPSAT